MYFIRILKNVRRTAINCKKILPCEQILIVKMVLTRLYENWENDCHAKWFLAFISEHDVIPFPVFHVQTPQGSWKRPAISLTANFCVNFDFFVYVCFWKLFTFLNLEVSRKHMNEPRILVLTLFEMLWYEQNQCFASQKPCLFLLCVSHGKWSIGFLSVRPFSLPS